MSKFCPLLTRSRLKVSSSVSLTPTINAQVRAKRRICWLRPDYQAPEATPEQAELATGSTDATPASCHPAPDPGDSAKKQYWPKSLQEQTRAVRDKLETVPMDAATLAANFKPKPEKAVTQVLDALSELGIVRADENGAYRMRGA